LDGLLCRFKGHTHSVPGERWNHQGGIPDGERCRRRSAETESRHSAKALRIGKGVTDPFGQAVKASCPEAFEEKIDPLAGSTSGVKESAEIHRSAFDPRESGITRSPDMHLKIMTQLQSLHVAFQADPRRRLAYATRSPDDSFSWLDAGFGHKVATKEREAFL
jgi:hypothetical protein